jgi:hypothetical protein
MKNLIYLIAVCFTVALIGCQSAQTVNPGAVSACCGAKHGEACTKAKSDCSHAERCQREASPGAVSDCTKQNTDCTKQKTDCTGQKKTDCHHDKTDANLGAVSEKAPCGAAKRAGCGR